MSKMDFVAVDIGASSTRFATETSKKIDIIPNNTVFIEPDANLNMDTQDKAIESNLDVTITRSDISNDVRLKVEGNGNEPFFPMRALIGEMAERYNAVPIRPNSNMPKHNQRVNYMSSLMAIALSKLSNPNMSEDIKLYMALPPIEVRNSKQDIKDYLTGSYTVTFNRIVDENRRTVKFNIVDVRCFEESRAALLEFILSCDKAMETAYANSMILSIDIGASTTDFVIFNKRKFLDKTGMTVPVGGNMLHDNIIDIITTRGDLISDDAVELLIREGRLRDGAELKVCGEIVDQAKERVVQDIAVRLNTYFTRMRITPKDISYIVVSGGGSMCSSYVDENGKVQVTSKPLSEFLTKIIHTMSPSTQVMFFSDEPRMANIRGLVSVARMEYMSQQ